MVQDLLSAGRIAPNVDGEVKCGEVDRDNEQFPQTALRQRLLEAVCLFNSESSATAGSVDLWMQSRSPLSYDDLAVSLHCVRCCSRIREACSASFHPHRTVGGQIRGQGLCDLRLEPALTQHASRGRVVISSLAAS